MAVRIDGTEAVTNRVHVLTIEELERMYERLDELQDWAAGEGYTAVQHKLEEAMGPLANATEAMRQYADGTLEVRY